jgi:hypothetical protein
MADYFWPSSLVPSASEWRLVSNTAVFNSPLTGATRTVARGGDRWACTFTFNNLTGANRAILQAFLSQLRGQANRCYVRDHSYVKRGSYPSSNLLPDFSSATPWTLQYATLACVDGVGRITAASHTGAQYPNIRYTTTGAVSGYPYAMRAFYTRSSTGTASVGPFIDDLTTSATSYSTAVGLKTARINTVSASIIGAVVIDGTGSSTATGDFADVPYTSLARCMQVSGGGQTGSVIAVDGSYSSSDLLAGDRIEIGGEFNMVADTFNGAAGTTKSIRLVRPVRSSPANLAPVIVHDPLCKMLLADNTVGWSNRPGQFSSVTVELVEDIT